MKRRYSQTEDSFPFSRNTRINGGTFNNIHRDNYQFHHSQLTYPQFNIVNNRSESGLDVLRQSIVTGAMHDSAERYPPGKCHAGTRGRIIKSIMDWFNDPNASNVLWLHGSAGAGKSAITQTIAELLKQDFLDQYGGSFFFARDIPGRNSADNLFSTLAYQISMNIPGMRTLINNAMDLDHTLPNKSMDIQLQSLIVDTMAQIPNLPHPPTVIIDGLDECHDSQIQRKVLCLIGEVINNSHVPLRFLIASRPEYWIEDSFDEHPLLNVATQFSLSDSTDVDKDIRKYLRDGFDKIYVANRDLMTGVALPWPSNRLIRDLVKRASGQFIYAATVLKFVGASSDFNNPHEQLKIISSPGPFQGSPFSDLDQLYTQILSRYPRRDTLLSVLGTLLVWHGVHHSENVDITSWITLTVEPSEMKIVMRSIASLIVVQDVEFDFGVEENEFYSTTIQQCRFSHLSFCEYLEDNNRSGPFFINVQDLLDSFCTKLFDLIHNGLNEGVKPHPHISQLAYRKIWNEFCIWQAYDISRTRVQQCVECLRGKIVQFRANVHLIRLPESLLHYLEYVERFILYYQYNSSHPMELSLADTILADIRALQDTAFQQILSVSLHPGELLDILSHCMADSTPGSAMDPSFQNICYLLGSDTMGTRMVLLKHFHFFTVDYFLPEYPPTYRPLSCLLKILCSPARGGSFHSQFRTCCISTCMNLILRVSQVIGGMSANPDEADVDEVDILSHAIPPFFNDRTLSDINGERDMDTMEDLASVLNTFDWRNFAVPGEAIDFRLELVFSVFSWLHRQLNNTDSLLIVPDQYPTYHKMQQTMGKIYDGCFSHWLQHPYLSEILIIRYLKSDSEPASFTLLHSIRGTEVQENDLLISDAPHINNLSRPSHPIGNVMPTMDRFFEGVKYDTHISPSHWYTLAAEFYLNIVAKNLYERLHPDLCLSRPRIYRGFKFDICLLHADPSGKIIIALRAIFYLCSELAGTWRAPYGFSLFTLGLLKKYNLDVQEMSEFTSWLELLKSDEVEDPNIY